MRKEELQYKRKKHKKQRKLRTWKQLEEMQQHSNMEEVRIGKEKITAFKVKGHQNDGSLVRTDLYSVTLHLSHRSFYSPMSSAPTAVITEKYSAFSLCQAHTVLLYLYFRL